MKTKWLQAVVVLIVMGVVGSVWAVETTWNGNAADGLWATSGNWSAGVPVTNPTSTGNINVGYVAASPTILITGTAVDCGSETVRPSDLHGPNFGATLNIDGVSFTHRGFVMAAVANDPALRSFINIYNGGQLNAINLCLGDTWWYTAPYVTLNIYDTSSVNVTDYIWLGGYINLYGGTINVTNGFNMAANFAAIEAFGDGLTRLNIEGGMFVIAQDYSTQFSDWIAAGYVTAYGLTPGRGADIVVDTTTVPGSTIVTAVYNYPATNPNPTPQNTDGSVGTLISDTQAEVTLNWLAGADPNGAVTGNAVNPKILTHHIWLSGGSTDPNLYYLASVPQTSLTDPNASYGPITLDENTVYYWSIEEGLDNGSGSPYGPGDPNNIAGPIWSFETRAATPEILTNPVNTVADPDASFMITDDGIATSYQWYKVGTPDVQLVDGGAYSGTTTATLTVTNASLAEEGQYYCVAANGPNSDTSDSAWLWTPRLMGHWKLDGNMLDSVADTVTGAPAHDGAIAGDGPGDANYSVGSGLDGGDVMEFFNDGDYVAIADAEFFNFYPLGFTLSFWYKENAAVGWRLPMSKLDAGAAGWLIGVDSGFRNQAVFFTNPDDGVELWADGNVDIDLGDGQWHMITVIYDPTDTTYTIFTDGDENESIVFDMSANPLPTAPLSIGGRASELSVDGAIDDVRIYSEVLSPLEVAQLYLAFEPSKWVCVEDPENPLNGFDIDGDCRITLSDIAEIASHWLECQRYPASACSE